MKRVKLSRVMDVFQLEVVPGVGEGRFATISVSLVRGTATGALATRNACSVGASSFPPIVKTPFPRRMFTGNFVVFPS